MSLTAACCNTPAVENAQWDNKGEFVTLSTEVDGQKRKTYLTGPKDSKRGIIAVYDIFGYRPTSQQFFDVCFCLFSVVVCIVQEKDEQE